MYLGIKCRSSKYSSCERECAVECHSTRVSRCLDVYIPRTVTTSIMQHRSKLYDEQVVAIMFVLLVTASFLHQCTADSNTPLLTEKHNVSVVQEELQRTALYQMLQHPNGEDLAGENILSYYR